MYRLKELRERCGFSQREVAEVLQTSQQQYSKMELGKTDLDGQKLKTLAQYFKVSVDYILGLSNEEYRR